MIPAKTQLHPDVKKLLAVQEVDQRIAGLRKDLDSVPRERAAREAELEGLRRRAAENRAKLSAAEVAVRSNQKALEEGDQEIKKLQERLNSVKNNAEYQAILLQIESVKRQIGTSEEEGLGLLEHIENVRTEVARVAEELAAAESVFEEFLVKGQALLDERQVQVDALDAERATLLEGIPPELLSEYERLFGVRSHLVVCAVEGETCTGCYMSIPPNLQVKLRAGTAVVKCDSCQRILYYAE